MAKNKKNGPLSEEEKVYIRSNMLNMSINQIGEELGRSPETISKYLGQMDMSDDKANILNLKKREDWSIIKKQFNEEEVAIFEWHWNEIIKQFADEIYHTEGMQLINALKHEILGNRALSAQMKLKKDIEAADKRLDDERSKDPMDFNKIDNLERLLSSLSQAIELNAKEYRECNKKLEDALKGLRALREQRLTRVEDGRKNFPVWMARLINDKTLQKELGVAAEKMRIAAEQEKLRFGKPYKYQDGMIDRPFLSMDTLQIEGDDLNDL